MALGNVGGSRHLGLPALPRGRPEKRQSWPKKRVGLITDCYSNCFPAGEALIGALAKLSSHKMLYCTKRFISAPAKERAMFETTVRSVKITL